MLNFKTPRQIELGNSDNVFFIAEAGINHNGEIQKAKELIDLAKRAGAKCGEISKKEQLIEF